MKLATRTSNVLVGAAVVGLMLAGCGSNWQNYDESLVKTSEDGLFGPKAPTWVKGSAARMPGDDEGRVYFVGRGVGYNTFDERGAYDAARDHVLQQVGKQIATWVRVRAVEVDARNFRAREKPWCVLVPYARGDRGPRFLPGERAEQLLAVQVKLTTSALAGDLVDEGVYWEQWSISEVPLDRTLLSNTPTRTMKRYKCWLRMSIDKQMLESRIQATLGALAIASHAHRPGKVFAVVAGHGDSPAGGAARLNPKGAEYLRRVARGCPHGRKVKELKKCEAKAPSAKKTDKAVIPDDRKIRSL